jgi:hypothetical protein
MVAVPAVGQQPSVQSEISALSALPDAPGAEAADENHSSATDAASNSASADSQPGGARIGGTVTDTNGDIVPGATVALDSVSGSDHRTATADDNAGFQFGGLKPGVPYRITVRAQGFVDWKSDAIQLHNGDFQFVAGIRLPILVDSTTVVVNAGSQEEIATEQVHIEEQQRVLGFIPNFYVVYDSKNAVPLTTRLKFQMALKVAADPVSFLGAGFLAGIDQAADTPNYPQGAQGYGERFGSIYADGVTDILFGGAILPSLLHQDPRYFYQGTGTKKSRTLHALSNPFICRGDNGKWQPNYSSIGGDLISSAISNAYYPASNRGAAFTFENLAIDTAEREVSSLVQEFVLRRLTPGAKRQQETGGPVR